MSKQLIIRKSDRAIFEGSHANDCDDTARFRDALSGQFALYELVPVKRSWWFGLKLVRSGAMWFPSHESLFDVVERSEVMAGLKLL